MGATPPVYRHTQRARLLPWLMGGGALLATLSVGGASVSCAQGETVSAGPLSLTCSTVEADSVELTASLS